MNRIILPLAPLVALFFISTVRAQQGPAPQVPPPPVEYVPPGVAAPPPVASFGGPQSSPPGPSCASPPPAQESPPPGGLNAPQPGPSPVPPPDPTPAAPPAEKSPCSVTAEALGLERTVGSSILLGSTRGAVVENLYSDESHFLLQAGARVEFASGDEKKKDESVEELIYWGLDDRWVGQAIYGDPTGNTTKVFSPWLQISKLDNGLNGALRYSCRSSIDNVESNTRDKLTPYDPAWNVDWLGGIRYVRFCDDFDLDGWDLAHGNAESLAYQTKNSLIGMQIGLRGQRGWDRFQLSGEGKVGLYANFYTQHGTDFGSGSPAITPSDDSHTSCDMAMLFEVSAMLRYRLAEELWLQAGYQYCCVTGLALAPRQLGGWSHNGIVGLDGLSLGVELTR
jgi:hypothetical protein